MTSRTVFLLNKKNTDVILKLSVGKSTSEMKQFGLILSHTPLHALYMSTSAYF